MAMYWYTDTKLSTAQR